MIPDIEKLRSIAKKTSQVINTKLENSSRNREDNRFWTLGKDEKTKSGQALIRFLPALKEDMLPWVVTYNYYVKCDNGWYINPSLRTIGQPDPMGEYIHDLWSKARANNDEVEMNRLRANYRCDMKYISNILVINDPKNPDNNGKVFLFRYGKKIYDKIFSKIHDDGLGETCNVFDWSEGANFKLRMKMVDKFPNYDSSEFLAPSALSDDDVLKIAESMYDLEEFIDPSKFKSYDELKARVEKVTNTGNGYTMQPSGVTFESPARKPVQEDDDPPFEMETKKTSEPELKTPWDDDDIDFDSLNSQLDEEVKQFENNGVSQVGNFKFREF